LRSEQDHLKSVGQSTIKVFVVRLIPSYVVTSIAMRKSNRNSKKKTSNKDFKLVTKKQVQDMFRTRASATNNYTDTSLTVSTINTHYVINLPVVGDASNSLSGQKFTLDKITVRLVMYANTLATTIP